MTSARNGAEGWLEFKRSWTTLLACCLGASLGAAAFPLFLVPVIGLRLEQQFGWSRFDTSSLTSVAFVAGALGALIVGWLNDKWSTKGPILISMLSIGVMFAFAAIAPSDINAWRTGVFAFMFLGAGTLSAPFIKIVCTHFSAIRGLTLGLTIGAVSFVSALGLPWISAALDHFGTQRFFLGAALAYGFIITPVLAWLLPRDVAQSATKAPQSSGPLTQTRPGALWALGIAGVLLSIVTGSAAHLAGLAADGHRYAPSQIGAVFAMGVLIARPLAGFIIDHVNAAHVGAAAAAMAALGLMVAALFGDRYLTVSALLLAASVGAEFDIVSYLASKYADAAHFGRQFSWMYAGMLLAAAVGPLFIAVQLAAFGAYRMPFLSAAFLAAIGSGIMLFLPPHATKDAPP